MEFLRACRVVLAVVALAVLAAACTTQPPPVIRVRDADVVIQNQSGAAWSGVEVWVNDHFRVTAASLDVGQVFVAPLNGFVAAYGQRFDRHLQPVFGVLVTATGGDRRPVRITWGKVRRK
jgi:hypothetical protein